MLKALRRKQHQHLPRFKRTKRSMSNPITELRSFMKAEGLSALVVPSEDAHQSEYTPLAEKRMKFISHFSGSAGTSSAMI
jgi:Xaa-Pro aminopeptidase